ncbi:MAG: hypothetical protein U0694_27210 [Anaerolineae bacterium]
MSTRRCFPWLLILLVGVVLAVLINWFVFNTPPQAQVEYFIGQVNALIQIVTGLVQGVTGGR